MATGPEVDWALEKAAEAIELPVTLESVEATRRNQQRFSHEKGHDILMRCWATMLKMLETQGGSHGCHVRIDITNSRPWPRVIAGAKDKVRSQLVGPGITQCCLEIEGNRKNPHTKKPQPNFVLTHTDGRKVIYHPGSTKQGLLAFREVDGQLKFETLKAEHRKQAFELAAGRYLKAGIVREFERSRRPSDDEFEIGSDAPWIGTVAVQGCGWKSLVEFGDVRFFSFWLFP